MAEVETTEQTTVLNDDNSTEDVSTPPVLSVSSSSSPPSEGATGTTSSSSPRDTRSSLSESQRGAPATIPGLTEMLNEWQISGIPEEQQFFATSVCL